ncbi:hypothetical protein [Modestobacter marinus]|uniref:hypothetical protein n=1 Tax=Modestobacter marinus TaxID=477641 RepID=UPI001C985AD6|nr:hypothetical protein [Modestobacter marinus]
MFTQRAAEGTHITPSIRLHATPGHTPQDITTLVGTADDVVALTHLWWTEEGQLTTPTRWTARSCGSSGNGSWTSRP